MTVDKVIAKIIWLTFFGPPCMCCVKKSQYVCITAAEYAEERTSWRSICQQATIRTACNTASSPSQYTAVDFYLLTVDCF